LRASGERGGGRGERDHEDIEKRIAFYKSRQGETNQGLLKTAKTAIEKCRTSDAGKMCEGRGRSKTLVSFKRKSRKIAFIR